jgi:hypothetical protein
VRERVATVKRWRWQVMGACEAQIVGEVGWEREAPPVRESQKETGGEDKWEEKKRREAVSSPERERQRRIRGEERTRRERKERKRRERGSSQLMKREKERECEWVFNGGEREWQIGSNVVDLWLSVWQS